MNRASRPRGASAGAARPSVRGALGAALVLLIASACTDNDARAPQVAPPPPQRASGIDEAQRLVDDGLYDDARAALARILSDGREHPQALHLQARLCYQQSQFEEALTWCDRAIAASPHWAEPRVLLAQSYIRLKRLAAAASVFADIDRIAPWSAWGPCGMGWVAAMRGQADRAVELLDRALDRDPTHIASLEIRIPLARQQNDTAMEERLLGRYLVQVPGSAPANVRLGEIAAAAGRREDARQHYERAYALEPRSATARQLAGLARQRGDADDENRWRSRSGSTDALDTPEPAVTQ